MLAMNLQSSCLGLQECWYYRLLPLHLFIINLSMLMLREVGKFSRDIQPMAERRGKAHM